MYLQIISPPVSGLDLFHYANTKIPGLLQPSRYHPHITMAHPINPPLVLLRWTLCREDDMLGVCRYALKVKICPHTRADDLLVLLRPVIYLLATRPDSNGIISRPVKRIDEMFYATTVSHPSHHFQFIIITVFEEVIRDLLISELADEELFGVRLEPEKLRAQDSVLRIPDHIFRSEPDNDGDVILNLRERITEPAAQLVLAELLRSHRIDDYAVLSALTEYYHLSDDSPAIETSNPL